MKFEYCEGKPILDHKPVKVKRMNHIVQVTSVSYQCKNFEKIKKLSADRYVDLTTGEVKEYQLSENRSENIASLKKTFGRLRDLINNNFVGSQNELHLTLTYAENMKDPERLYKDFKAFWKRFKYRYGNHFDYINVVEPQARGAWHCHCLIRSNNNEENLFIPSSELAEVWGHGFVKIKALKEVDNIGAYLSAYLADIELTDDTFADLICTKNGQATIRGSGVKEVEVDGQKKSIIKGGRLHLYPAGMNLYRCSRGIKPPEVEEMPYSEVKKIVGSATPNYSRTINITDDIDGSSKLLNSITYEYYNIKRL